MNIKQIIEDKHLISYIWRSHSYRTEEVTKIICFYNILDKKYCIICEDVTKQIYIYIYIYIHIHIYTLCLGIYINIYAHIYSFNNEENYTNVI